LGKCPFVTASDDAHGGRNGCKYSVSLDAPLSSCMIECGNLARNHI
jgi:hypothetical protein